MDILNSLDVQEWRDELEAFRQEWCASMLSGDPSDVEEELRTCLEALDTRLGHPIEPSRHPQNFRRSIDVVHRACVVTDHNCVIRRTNRAFLSTLNLPQDTAIPGMPFLVFVKKEDRRRFTEAFMRLRSRQLPYSGEMFFEMRPLRPSPHFLAHLSAHVVDGKDGKLVSIIWLFENSSLP